MFVKLVSRKQCLIPHCEPQETDSRAEMVGVSSTCMQSYL